VAILLRDISLPAPIDNEMADLVYAATRQLAVPQDEITVRILRKALDARRANAIRYTYHLAVDFHDAEAEKRLGDKHEPLPPTPQPTPTRGAHRLAHRPVVVGSGPAGLFAALLLAENGFNPLILERGSPVDRRTEKIGRFLDTRALDENNNFLRGEGGAGTYSDGKLTSRSKDPWRQWVLDQLVAAGAPKETACLARPHIGSDNLPRIVSTVRSRIEALGGAFHFDTKVSRLMLDGARLKGLVLGTGETLGAETVILAPGASARELYQALAAQDVALEAKPFQMGVRIEHPQSLIDRWKFHGKRARLKLPAAEYFIALKSSPLALHSFCMCPGGWVMPAVERPGLIATNGASPHARDGRFASSALVVTVDPANLGETGPLAGMRFQLAIEEAAWQAAGGGFSLPCQHAAQWLTGRSGPGRIESSYPFETRPVDLSALMPSWLTTSLKDGLARMDRKVRGFASGHALLLWPESRASSPVRIPRDPDTLQSLSTPGLFPAGEGAGYAGGIMSSASDGLHAASKLVESFAPAP